MDILNDFILFLIEQECVEEYFINLEWDGKDPNTFFKMCHIADWIYDAFEWSVAPEDYTYWSYVETQWLERLKNNGYTK